jgi:hypothetical protein
MLTNALAFILSALRKGCCKINDNRHERGFPNRMDNDAFRLSSRWLVTVRATLLAMLSLNGFAKQKTSIFLNCHRIMNKDL